MTKPRSRVDPAVFADANILVAATLSPSGGSFRLLQESSSKNINLSTNLYALDEAEEVIRKKYPQHSARLKQLIPWSRIKIFKDPSEKAVSKYLSAINPKDAPILAGGIDAKARFLITLDRKDFLTTALRRSNLPILITTPHDFFQQYYRF